MEKKSKEQLKVEKYFEENNVVYDENYIYAVKRERNLNALLMSGLLDWYLRQEYSLITFFLEMMKYYFLKLEPLVE